MSYFGNIPSPVPLNEQQIADAGDPRYLNVSGDTVSGNLDVSGDLTIIGNTFLSTINIGGNTAPPVSLFVEGSSAGVIGVLSDSANIAINLANFNNFSVTLEGNRNIDNPTGLVPGQSGIIFITQDSTGSRTLSWSSYWKFTGNTAPTLTVDANAVDCVAYFVRSNTSIVSQFIENIG